MQQKILDLLIKNKPAQGDLSSINNNIYSIVGYTISCLRKADWSYSDLQLFREILMSLNDENEVLRTCKNVLNFK
jgi:hypothetical protein